MGSIIFGIMCLAIAALFLSAIPGLDKEKDKFETVVSLLIAAAGGIVGFVFCSRGISDIVAAAATP